MTHSVHTLIAGNGQSLHYQSWRPDGPLRAVMLVVHGAAEHGGRYADFASQVNSQGFAVTTVDLPGHGKSYGKQCCVRDIDEYLRAVELAHDYAEQDFTVGGRSNTSNDPEAVVPVPFFLVGHSMGGLVASLYLQRHQTRFQGAVFSGAAVLADPEPGWMQVAIMRVLAKIAPSMGALQLDAAGVSRDAEVVSRYVNDPLVYTGKLTASMLVAMFTGMKRTHEGLPGITLPALVMHGEADTLVTPDASRILFERIGSTDKTLKLFPGLYHEIFNEPERVDVVNDVIAWVEARLR